jgi:type II secretory pathway pseudopilin PulG
MRTSKLPAQILVITLLALVIISIIIVGVFNLTTRDVQQTVANREYEKLLNASESKMFEVVDEMAKNVQLSVSNLIRSTSTSPLRNMAPNCVTITTDSIQCTFIQGTQTTTLDALDTPTIEGYELGKDDSITLDLSGYRGDIQFRVSPGSGLEFAMMYTLAGVPTVLRDYFEPNPATAIDNNGNDPVSDPDNLHIYQFSPVAGTDYYRFTVGSTTGLPATAITQTLTITGRRREQGIALLDLSGGVGFPKQVRKLTTVSYDATGGTNIVARVVSQIPLEAQHIALLNYAILTPGGLSK